MALYFYFISHFKHQFTWFMSHVIRWLDFIFMLKVHFYQVWLLFSATIIVWLMGYQDGSMVRDWFCMHCQAYHIYRSVNIEYFWLTAEGKPPLFNMNAMAALYHIPQNDAPTLADAHWSNDFRSFVETCLIKDPDHRPNATQAMTVCFVMYSRGSDNGLFWISDYVLTINS